MSAPATVASLLDLLCSGLPRELGDQLPRLHPSIPVVLIDLDPADLDACGSEACNLHALRGLEGDVAVARLVAADGRHLEDVCAGCLVSEAHFWSRRTRVGVRVKIAAVTP